MGTDFDPTGTSGLNPAFQNLGSVSFRTGFFSRVELGATPEVNALTNRFSVATWIKRRAEDIDTHSIVFDNGNDAGRWRVGLTAQNTPFYALEPGTPYAGSSQPITDTLWHHLAWVFDNGQLDMYRDGALVHSASGVTVAGNTTGPKYLGLGTNFIFAEKLDGSLDEFRLFSRALSAAEVSALMQHGCPQDGLSWAAAFQDLHCATARSASGDDIWVARGNYVPGVIITATFLLFKNPAMYGGFTGS